jgi:hypothetical protein
MWPHKTSTARTALPNRDVSPEPQPVYLPTRLWSNLDMCTVRILIGGDPCWYCPDLALSILRRLIDRYAGPFERRSSDGRSSDGGSGGDRSSEERRDRRGPPNLVLVHTGGCGVERSFTEVAKLLGVETELHLMDWKGLANATATARNAEMVEAGADLCVILRARRYRYAETDDGDDDIPF